MNVLLVSQCNKNALKESRRILDQFAERRGERTWQTAITQDGLNTLRKLLRKTARKNTAVACHWIRGKDHSELMWIVGDASQFNMHGATPTNSTARNVLRAEDENDWHTLDIIRVLAQLAALLHDLGKASVAFQERLQGQLTEKNLYRHEWVSLRLFQAFVGTDTDEQWLQRLAEETTEDHAIWTMPGRYWRDGLDAGEANQHPFRILTTQAPLAAAIGWLVVTHHRLPLKPATDSNGKQIWLGAKGSFPGLHELPQLLSQVTHGWNEQVQDAEQTQKEKYWSLQGDLPVTSPVWRKQAAKLAKRLISLQQTHRGNWLDNPYVMHLARLCLMLGDHHYSSLGLSTADKPVAGRAPFLQANQMLAANTTYRQSGQRVANQSLLEHLLGVAHGSATIAHALPGFERYLPRLANHRGLRKRSANPRFSWQDKAFDAATAMRESTRQQGAFIINMASTGCGKTLANARILYALADPQQGMRATYALGLRTLTLQTGRSYRKDLHLNEDELAIQVGGSASRALFEYYEQKAELCGSASVQGLLEEDGHVLYEGNSSDHPLLEKALANADIRKLLSAPMLVCTVDHLVPATESQRAGRQIAPMLRLMSSDLILDELDDYDLNDLPALTRLVHWAGLLGSRIILSSATLPPALVAGMYMAYREGRQHYLKNRGTHNAVAAVADIPCLWVDEFGVQSEQATDAEVFEQHHQQFIRKRVSQLAKDTPCRLADIIPMTITVRQPDAVYPELARIIRDECIRLHKNHSEPDPQSSKHVSFGIVRMANIEAIIQVARALYALGASDDAHIHLCVYHSRFPLVQRSAIENLLDTAFNRRDDGGQAVYQQPQIRNALETTAAQHQVFVVLASPVCEVGRDWDADWAIAEPSSMRSLIQLAGRVQRHRRKIPQHANMLLLDAPVKYFTHVNNDDGIYQRPGFEKGTQGSQFRLTSPWLHDLLQVEEYRHLNAVPRIYPRPAEEQTPRNNLVDLEQARIAASMYPRPKPANVSRRNTQIQWLQQEEAAPAWVHPHNLLTGVLAQYQPFRDPAGSQTLTLVFRPDDDEEQLLIHRVEDNRSARGQHLYIPIDHGQRHNLLLEPAPGISVWGDFDVMTLVREQADALDISLERCAEKMTTVEVLKSDSGWYWHPWLGFMKRQ
ncbi:MAG: type I-F CRISPR-associated helicase Cas3f [Saccharospirillaceae bacterium]|nr:type I-F CRISPR-associated helicase Cas3f [Saccharospirillaceae bacterium]MCD8530709.1 type I-F CRISPR-associated helicase Cas3f [Saccharospirillaceae bacterium]